MKPQSEMIEGPEASTRFDSFVGRVLAVPHSVVAVKSQKKKHQTALNPNLAVQKRRLQRPLPSSLPFSLTLRNHSYLPPSGSTAGRSTGVPQSENRDPKRSASVTTHHHQ